MSKYLIGKMLNGRHAGGKPPLGYDVDSSTMKLNETLFCEMTQPLRFWQYDILPYL